MPGPQWFVLAALLPAVGAAAIGILGRWWRVPLLWAVGVALAYVAAHQQTEGWPAWPPVEAQDWLLVAALPGVLVVALVASMLRPRWAWVIRAAAGLGLPPLLLQVYLTTHWSAGQSAWRFPLLGIATAGLWLSLHAQARPGEDRPARWLLAALAMAAGAAGVVLLAAAESISLGQLAGALATILLGVWLASLFAGRSAEHIAIAAVVDVAWVLLAGLLLIGHFYGTSIPWLALTIALAPQLGWIGAAPGVRRLRPSANAACRLAAVAIPLVVAAGIAIAQFLAAQAEAANDPYSGY